MRIFIGATRSTSNQDIMHVAGILRTGLDLWHEKVKQVSESEIGLWKEAWVYWHTLDFHHIHRSLRAL